MPNNASIDDETANSLFGYLANVCTSQAAGATRELDLIRRAVEARDLKAAQAAYARAVDGLLSIGKAMKHSCEVMNVVPDGTFAPWRETEPTKRLANEMTELGEIPVLAGPSA